MRFKLTSKQAGLALITFLLLFEYAYIPWENWVEEKKKNIEIAEATLVKQHNALNRQKHFQEVNKYISDGLDPLFKKVTAVEQGNNGSLDWLKFVDDTLAQDESIKVNIKRPEKLIEINGETFVFVGSVNFQGPSSNVLNILKSFDDIQSGHQIRTLSLVMRNKNSNLLVANFEFVKLYRKL